MTIAKNLRGIFTNKKGEIIIGQWPNTPLILAIGSYLIKYLPFSIAGQFSFWGVLISLTYWSYLEIFYGDNTFRRILGVVVLVSQLIKVFNILF
ncbi:hypothetical protein IPM62_01420 [Candidatus Woesebacteria bacterium]|nr:MAG: hypothetical protein IPM62_01420 [Candidatus Woesebacteria bacterium]